MDFSASITEWYALNRRDLPWRSTKDPYKIWLSEVILQQTRVNQGMSYYLKFIARFPHICDMAQAAEDEVLKLWQGLGYYSRARNLHHAAKEVCHQHAGVFPSTYEAIKSLKGVGEYTAAAIASFAFNLVHPVIDGNVYRVLSRYFGIETPIDSTEGKNYFRKLAETLISQEDPATYNQAIMEFGALQCVPKNPDCEQCVLRNSCVARARKWVDRLPVKARKTLVSERWLYYLVIEDKGIFYLKKRTGVAIWKNLFDFPLIESLSPLKRKEIEEKIRTTSWFEEDTPVITHWSAPWKHVLSHRILYAEFIHLKPGKKFKPEPFWIKSPARQMPEAAIPRLIERYLEETLPSGDNP